MRKPSSRTIKRTLTTMAATVVAITAAFAWPSPAQAHTEWTPDFIRVSYNGKCLDAASGGNGAKVQMWDCNSTASNQQWFLVHQFNYNGWRLYQIRNRAYSKCLDADTSQGALRNGTKVQLWNCISGAPNQLWNIYSIPNTGGSLWRIHTQLHHQIVLDADTSNGSVNGMKVQMWSCCNGSNKEFYSPIFR